MKENHAVRKRIQVNVEREGRRTTETLGDMNFLAHTFSGASAASI